MRMHFEILATIQFIARPGEVMYARRCKQDGKRSWATTWLQVVLLLSAPIVSSTLGATTPAPVGGAAPVTADDSPANPQAMPPPGEFGAPSFASDAAPATRAVAPLSEPPAAAAASWTTLATEQAATRREIEQLRSAFEKRINPLLISALALIFGAVLSWLSMAWKERGEEKRAVRTVSVTAMAQIMATRSKQIEKLYGPLNALLSQSHGVFQRLCEFLAARDAGQYQWDEKDPESMSGRSFQIRKGGQWAPFRLLDELPHAYDPNTAAGPLIDEIMAVGKRMVQTLHDNAGLVLTRHSELPKLFGDYLAHYVVLEEMYKAVLNASSDAESLKGRYLSGHFPRELPKKVAEGLAEISTQLDKLETQLTDLAFGKSCLPAASPVAVQAVDAAGNASAKANKPVSAQAKILAKTKEGGHG